MARVQSTRYLHLCRGVSSLDDGVVPPPSRSLLSGPPWRKRHDFISPKTSPHRRNGPLNNIPTQMSSNVAVSWGMNNHLVYSRSAPATKAQIWRGATVDSRHLLTRRMRQTQDSSHQLSSYLAMRKPKLRGYSTNDVRKCRTSVIGVPFIVLDSAALWLTMSCIQHNILLHSRWLTTAYCRLH